MDGAAAGHFQEDGGCGQGISHEGFGVGVVPAVAVQGEGEAVDFYEGRSADEVPDCQVRVCLNTTCQETCQPWRLTNMGDAKFKLVCSVLASGSNTLLRLFDATVANYPPSHGSGKADCVDLT